MAFQHQPPPYKPDPENNGGLTQQAQEMKANQQLVQSVLNLDARGVHRESPHQSKVVQQFVCKKCKAVDMNATFDRQVSHEGVAQIEKCMMCGNENR
jgi:hypothetical protein